MIFLPQEGGSPGWPQTWPWYKDHQQVLHNSQVAHCPGPASQFEHPHRQETLVSFTSNPYTTYNGYHKIFKKVHRHSGVAVLVDTGYRSRKYSRIRSNVQSVPRDLWPGQQSANGHNKSLYLAGNAGFAYQTQPLQELTTDHTIVPFNVRLLQTQWDFLARPETVITLG